MKNTLRIIALLFGWGLFLLGGHSAHASHIQGGQITYRYVSGNTYEVTVSFYRDCNPTASTLPTSVGITAVPSCGGTAVTATLNPVGPRIIGQGYCAAIQALATCNPGSTLYANYERQDFQGTIILPPAANWIISHQSCCRPSTGNIPTQDDFRFEATLNNQVTVNGVPTRVNNSSPLFSSRDFPVPFVLVNQRTSINFTAASEVDGDSLVYELDRPLATCGIFNPYSTRPVTGTGCVPRVLTSPPGTSCVLACSPLLSNANYSANLPLPVANDTVGVCSTVPGTASTRMVVPRFVFNPRIGEFTFTPNLYRTGSTALGLNKYVVVGKITEYRRLPGSNRRYRVGSVRRDFLIIVIDGSGNQVPTPPVISVSDPLSGATPTNLPDTTRINILTCNYARVRVSFTDPDNLANPPANPLQLLTVTYTGAGDINADALQAGDVGVYSLGRNGTSNPVATFFFQPAAALAGQTIRLPFRIEDNACPIKGTQTRILEIKIRNGRTATAGATIGAPGLGNTTVASICPGGSLQLQGFVNRPDSIRSIAGQMTRLQRYGFQWTAVNVTPNNSGLPTITNAPTLAVNPVVTTRYRIRIIPLDGFGTNGGGCGDTTSVLVRVVPEPQVQITTPNTTVCPNTPVVLTSNVTRPDALTDTYSYEWTGPNNFTANTATVTVTPTTASTYSVAVRGNTQYGCEASSQIQLSVVPTPVAAFTQTAVMSSRPGSLSLIPPVTFTFANNSTLDPPTPNLAIDSVRWTYQRVKTASGDAITPLPAPVRFPRSLVTATTATTPPLPSGYYIIRLAVSIRAAGTDCPVSETQQTVFVPNLQLPNIITPNGDNFNDVFVVNSDQYGGKLELFNRWGRKVEEIADYKNTWGGADQGPGVYYYYLTDRAGNKTKGWVEVVK